MKVFRSWPLPSPILRPPGGGAVRGCTHPGTDTTNGRGRFFSLSLRRAQNPPQHGAWKERPIRSPASGLEAPALDASC